MWPFSFPILFLMHSQGRLDISGTIAGCTCSSCCVKFLPDEAYPYCMSEPIFHILLLLISVQAKPQSKVQMAANSSSGAPKALVSVPATSADEELEKRKARAARFGIALVEPSKPKTKSTPIIAPKAVKVADVRLILFNATFVVTHCNYRTLKNWRRARSALAPPSRSSLWLRLLQL